MRWIYRFHDNCKKQDKIKGHLTIDELQKATNILVRLVQEGEFEEELQCLKDSGCVKTKSSLIKLTRQYHKDRRKIAIFRIGF